MSDPAELDRLKLERAAAGEEEDAKPTRVATESDQQRRGGFALTATPLLLHLINLVGICENTRDILLLTLNRTLFHLLWGGEGRVAEKSLASPPLPLSDVQQVHSLSQRETERRGRNVCEAGNWKIEAAGAACSFPYPKRASQITQLDL